MLETLFAIHQNSLKGVPYKKHRYLYDEIAWETQAICITGARGVGKTTLLLQYYHEKFDDIEKCLYLSADNIQVAALGLFEIAQEYFKYGGKALIIDEIHKYPSWSQEVKNIIDTYKEKQIFISGSSSIALHHGLADLSRRVVFYELKGLSFREYLNFTTSHEFAPHPLKEILKNHVKLAGEIISKLPVLKNFKNYLRHGYYPYFLEGEEVYSSKLLNVIEKVITEDIPSIFNVSPAKIPVLKKMLWLIATSQSLVPNIEKISRSLGLSKEYTYHFLEYLQKAGLVRFVSAGGKGHKLVRKPGKVYLENTNLMDALLGSLKIGEDVGVTRETFFLNQTDQIGTTLGTKANFLLEKEYSFEVGGPGKNREQIAELKNAHLAIDNLEIGSGNKIPLYLFGFFY